MFHLLGRTGGQHLTNVFQILQNALFDLILLLELLFIEPQLITRKFAGTMISVLMAIWAEDNEVVDIVGASISLLDDVVEFKALLGTNCAAMAGLDQKLIANRFGNRHPKNIAKAPSGIDDPSA